MESSITMSVDLYGTQSVYQLLFKSLTNTVKLSFINRSARPN